MITPKHKKNNKFLLKGRELDAAALLQVQDILGSRSTSPDLLIEHLHIINDHYGELSKPHLVALASLMKLSMAEVYEVATFYHHFKITDELSDGLKKITLRVCDGLSCEMSGAKKLFADLAEKFGAQVDVTQAPCMGGCDKAPVAVVGKNQVTDATLESVSVSIIKKQTTPVKFNYENLKSYQQSGGYGVWQDCLISKRSVNQIKSELDQAGLKGLGGAGFPVARKWGFFDGSTGIKYVCVNADEGEPGTFKDRHILETKPHQMIEGALIAAYVIGAKEIYIYLRDEYAAARGILLSEIKSLEQSGLMRGVKIHLRRGAGAYICGEESAMLESIEGKRGLPRNRPPFPANAGLFGKPTLIQNVETLYWVTEILKSGVKKYVNAGRPHFYSVSGRIKNPGVKLAPSGVTVRQLIDDFSGGMRDGHTLKAFLPGGASGGILPRDQADTPLDFGSLDDLGCFIGSSAVVVFSEMDDVKNVCRNLINFFKNESCGQCTPCRVGCEKIEQLISAPVWDKPLIDELTSCMRDASICGLGQAAPNPVLSAFRFFGVDQS